MNAIPIPSAKSALRREMIARRDALPETERARIVAALVEQAERLPLTSRAVHNDRMGPFL
jgi:5-formyltetrahydrofolate cyclo-ligase